MLETVREQGNNIGKPKYHSIVGYWKCNSAFYIWTLVSAVTVMYHVTGSTSFLAIANVCGLQCQDYINYFGSLLCTKLPLFNE